MSTPDKDHPSKEEIEITKIIIGAILPLGDSSKLRVLAAVGMYISGAGPLYKAMLDSRIEELSAAKIVGKA